MKKRNFGALQLNKKVISSFDVEKVKAGFGPSDFLTKDWYIDEDGNYVCISFFCR